jgi:serine/threonine-protein kinase
VEDDPRYQVLGEIARGGIGIVYKSRDKDLNREVALKVLRPEYADRDDVIQRFIEEAQVGGQLQHPGIVPVYGLGLQKDGRPSFAMKLIKGQTLAELLANNRRGVDLLTVFEQVAQTIAYAHSRGVIHRDVKPANVMVGAFGEVQVVDWGFAKVLGQEELAPRPDRTVIATVRSGEEGSQSIAGSIMGTPAYMPPEQALGHIAELDEASDVFALGAILCEILTGKPPYTGKQKDQLVAASQCLLQPAFERLDAADADDELKRIVRDCLQPLGADRPRNARVLADRLATHFAQAEERARQAELDAVASESNAAREQHKKRRTLVLATAALLLIAASGGGYLWSWLERTAREERARPRIAAALREAKGREGERDWTKAMAAARKAVDIAATAGLDDQAGADALLARYVREKAAADEAASLEAADRRLLVKLERARALEQEHHGVKAKDEAFTKAVRERWPDMKVDVERLRRSPRAEAFAAAFDDWAWLRKEKLKEKDWRTIDAWARAIDPEHNELRDVLAAEDIAALKEFLRTEHLDSLPVAKISSIGHVLHENDEEKQAIALLRRAARLYPDEYWIHAQLGTAAHKAKDRTLAVRHFQAALAIRPGSIEAHHWLGIALEKAGDLEGALAMWRAARDREADWAHGLGHIAEVLGKLGRHEEALATFREAVRLGDQATHSRMGVYLNGRGRYREAVEAFRKTIELDPEGADANAYNWLGRALANADDWEGAAEAHRFARSLEPGNAVANNRLANVLQMEGGEFDDEAFARCQLAVEQEPDDPEHHFLLAERLVRRHRVSEGLAALRKAIELRPEGANYHWLLGKTLLTLSRSGRARAVDGAIASLRKAVELDPANALWRVDLAVALGWAGQHAEAIDQIRVAIELDPADIVVRHNSGVVLARAGRLDEAIDIVRAGIDIAPDSWQAWACLKDLYRWAGDEDGEIEAFRRAAELNPGLQTDLAYRLENLYRRDEAVAVYRGILDRRPEFGTTRYDLATTLMNAGAPEEAIPEFERAIEIYPNYAQAHCNVGWCYAKIGEWRKALPWLRKGHALGSGQKGWSYASADWIARNEAKVALEPVLARVLDGKEVETTQEERLLLAEMLTAKRSFALSARYYRDALAHDASLQAYPSRYMWRAVNVAVRAGPAWHEQTLAWMRVMLANMREAVRSNPGGVYQDTLVWQRHPVLAPVRDAADLPDDWRDLWADARILHEQARRILAGGSK